MTTVASRTEIPEQRPSPDLELTLDAPLTLIEADPAALPLADAAPTAPGIPATLVDTATQANTAMHANTATHADHATGVDPVALAETVALAVSAALVDSVVAVPFGTAAVAQAEALAAAGGLRVLATGVWPADGGDEVPGVAGFIVSSFNPLVVEVARRALATYYGPPPAPDGAATAVVVVSAYGDVTSARTVADAVDTGGRVGPLLFFQSVPNAVAGYVAAHWGLAGPVVAISPADDADGAAVAEGMAMAGLLIDDGDADRALLVFVEQAGGGGRQPGGERDGGADERDLGDRGLAVLVERLRSEERD